MGSLEEKFGEHMDQGGLDLRTILVMADISMAHGLGRPIHDIVADIGGIDAVAELTDPVVAEELKKRMQREE
jgi:hypothetical protein